MNRSTLLLSAAVVVLAAGLTSSIITRPAPGLSAAEVKSVVSDMLNEELAMARLPATVAGGAVDAATIHPMIESYLLANPRILERVSTALQAEVRAEQRQHARQAIAGIADAIFNDPDHVVLGNPDGDVTLVEMFDYNCSYCRNALPDIAALLDEDPQLKIILKEFPILSQESIDAARIGVADSQAGGDYWAFHEQLFTGRGQVTRATAIEAVRAIGLNPVMIELDAQSEAVNAVIQRSYDIAQALQVSGTPTFIIGDEVIPGAVGVDALRTRIANMRACGKPDCAG